jgi:hypothetical protein
MMKDTDFETCFVMNETQGAISITYADRKSFVVYAKDVREVKKTTWRAACKRSPQLLDMVKGGDLRVLTMPEDVNEIMQIVEKLDKLTRVKQMEWERLSPEDSALALQQKLRAGYNEAASPFHRNEDREIV